MTQLQDDWIWQRVFEQLNINDTLSIEAIENVYFESHEFEFTGMGSGENNSGYLAFRIEQQFYFLKTIEEVKSYGGNEYHTNLYTTSDIPEFLDMFKNYYIEPNQELIMLQLNQKLQNELTSQNVKPKKLKI